MKDASQASSTGLDPKLAAALGYIPVVDLIFFFVEKSSKFVKFHAAQGLFLTIAVIAINIVCGILGFIPFLGWLFNLIYWLAYIGYIVIRIIAALNAYKLEWYKIPYVGDMAMKQIESM